MVAETTQSTIADDMAEMPAGEATVGDITVTAPIRTLDGVDMGEMDDEMGGDMTETTDG